MIEMLPALNVRAGACDRVNGPEAVETAPSRASRAAPCRMMGGGKLATAGGVAADAILPPNAAPERVGLVAAGNPNVLREAEGLEDYSRKRKRGGRVKVGAISGVR